MNAQSVLLYMGNADLSKESLTISQKTGMFIFVKAPLFYIFLLERIDICQKYAKMLIESQTYL